MIAGPDLERVLTEARQVRTILGAFPTHYPRPILEQATIAGALVPGALDQDIQAVADAVAARLDLIAVEYERGWQGRPTQDHGLRLFRVLRGVEEVRSTTSCRAMQFFVPVGSVSHIVQKPACQPKRRSW